MCKKTLEQLRSGSEFVNYARKHGAVIQQTCSSHVKIKTHAGTTVVPVHPGDLGKGLRCSLLKQFAAIGLVVLAGLIGLAWIF